MCQSCGCNSVQPSTQVLHVTGMSCEHCKKAVEKALLALPGVLAAEVDLAANTATVNYDHHRTSVADMKKAVADAGYTVTD